MVNYFNAPDCRSKLETRIGARHQPLGERVFTRRGVPRWTTDGNGDPTMADDPKEKPKTNGQDEDDDDRKEEPWPDDNVPRPPFMPPPDQPSPDA